jgi:chemotaxis protein MotB
MGRRTFESEQPSTNRWLITYTDLCTLLLTFFVLLVSMSTIDNRRERKALDSLVGSFGPMPGGRSFAGRLKGPDASEKATSTPTGRALDLAMLRELNTKNRLEAEEVQGDKDKTIVRIRGKILFLPGSTQLNPEVLSYLNEVAAHFVNGTQEIEIRGHTDLFEGIHQPNWTEDSWGLSLKRAQAVYDYFQLRGVDVNRMTCHGYSYYRPLVNSREYPHQSESNQRVEIVLGPNDHLPEGLSRDARPGAHGFNYRNFFFRLFPREENSDPTYEWEKQDIYDWVNDKKE